jgi:hypothetical protein
MRSEIEIRALYKQYCYRRAIAEIDNNKEKKDQFFGATFALGRTLDKDLLKINNDIQVASNFIKRLKKEGKELPGFKEV